MKKRIIFIRSLEFLFVFLFCSFLFIRNVSADVDTTPPTGTILINNGALYTNSRDVVLTLSATDDLSDVTEMQFNNGTGAYSAFEPYATTKAWTLSASDDLVKNVRVKFKDGAGNTTSPGILATITLDTVPPIITLNGTDTINLNVGDVFTDPGAIVDDGSLINITGLVDTNISGSYILTYNAADLAGNSAVPVTRTINITGLVLPPEVTLSSIEITTLPNKLDYKVGENLDITGLIVTGTYSDSSKKILTVSNSDISGFDNSIAINNQVLTITIDGKIITYNINISEIIIPTTEDIPIVKHKNTGSYLPVLNKLNNQNIVPSIENKKEIIPIKIENNYPKKEINTKIKKENETIKNNDILPISQTASAMNSIPLNKINIYLLITICIIILSASIYKFFILK